MYLYRKEDLFIEDEDVAVTKSYFIKDRLPEHSHDYIEISYIYSGVGYHILNGVYYKIKKGDLFFISKNSHHTYFAENEELKWLNIMFLPSAIDKHIMDISSLVDLLNLTIFSGTFHLSKISMDDISLFKHEVDFHDVFFAMYDEYSAKKIGYKSILRNYLSILLTKIFRSLSDNTSKQADRQSDLINSVINYLSEHTLNEIKTSEIAKNIFLSPTYFPKLFKKQTGMTINSYIRDSKMKMASDLLVTTDHSILDIINEVGYSDTKFFYSAFKQKYGITPAKYRATHKTL